MIDVERLCYSLQETPVLTNLNFSVPPACVFHIQAGNGAGKTTLLQLLCGLKRPDSGVIYYNNQSIYRQLRHFQKKINYIGHQTPLQNQLSIAEHCLLLNVAAESYNKGIDYFQLTRCQHIPAARLSAGQRKKAVLMNLLFNIRPIWILDEPFVGLDEISVNTFMNMINSHVANGGLAVLTSHQALPPIKTKVMSLTL